MPPKKCLLNGKNTCTNLFGRSQTETFVIDFLRVSPPSQLIERFLFYQLSSDHWLFFAGSFHLDAIMVGDGLTDPGTQVPIVCPVFVLCGRCRCNNEVTPNPPWSNFNSSHLPGGRAPKRSFIFQTKCFRCCVSFGEVSDVNLWHTDGAAQEFNCSSLQGMLIQLAV